MVAADAFVAAFTLADTAEALSVAGAVVRAAVGVGEDFTAIA